MNREFYEPFIDCVFPFSFDGSNWKRSSLYQSAQKIRSEKAEKNYLSRNDNRFNSDCFIYFHRRRVDGIFTHWPRYNPSSRRNHFVFDLFENDLSSPPCRTQGLSGRSRAIHRSSGYSSNRRAFGASSRYDFCSATIKPYSDKCDSDRLGSFFDHSTGSHFSTKTSRFSRHSCPGKIDGIDIDSDLCPDVPERPQYVHERKQGVSYKLIVAYNGTGYFGWQKTKNHPTIQDEIEKAYGQIFQGDVQTEAASRTDKGVHARGQVVQLVCAQEIVPRKLAKKLVGALNSKLPSDIRILAAEQTDPDFHVTLDSLAKTYSYYLNLGISSDPFLRLFAWHYFYDLDLEKMRAAAKEMVGLRNFAAFTTLKTTNGIRHLYKIDIVQVEANCIRIDMTGDRFLYKMARTIAGTLADIGSGKMDISCLVDLFSNGVRPLAGVTAPAHGLTLQCIYYSKEKLESDILER